MFKLSAALRSRTHVDRPMLIILACLILLGIVMFLSAALGQLARDTHSILPIIFNHLALGVGVGVVLMIVAANIPYKHWRRFAPYLYGSSLLFTALVFIPYISLAAGGARRWLLLGPISLQPSEFLKVGVILFLAYYLAKYRSRISSWRYGLGAFLLILAPAGVLLLAQPDTGTLGIIVCAGLAMFIAAGAPWRQIFALLGLGIVMLAILAMLRPYVLDRVMTFINPSKEQHSTGYQIKQSLLAIGSGGLTGRGLGQGIQKFSYLPEPMSDSIFAVAAEEFGFLGTITIVGLFTAFAARGLSIAAHAADQFGAFVAVGIVTYIAVEAFVNIGSMLGMLPLTGIPLVFISHGGTAMLTALGAVGILLNISKTRSAKRLTE